MAEHPKKYLVRNAFRSLNFLCSSIGTYILREVYLKSELSFLSRQQRGVTDVNRADQFGSNRTETGAAGDRLIERVSVGDNFPH